MGRHRLDGHDGDKWGGPDLLSGLDDRETATHSTSEGDATVNGAPAGQGRATADSTPGTA